MEQSWFEMNDIRRRKFSTAVWIPLRSVWRRNNSVKYGSLGFVEEFYGLKSLAVPIDKKNDILKYGWGTLGVVNRHSGYVDDDGKYITADSYIGDSGGELGIQLTFDQYLNKAEKRIWHVHQDLVLTLKLFREGDIWICPNESYIDVIRLSRDRVGEPELLEIRTEFLLDYLCARKMGLFTSVYRSRRKISKEKDQINWPKGRLAQGKGHDKWQGSVVEIHEGGDPYGSSTAVFWVGRNDVDPVEDVPKFGPATDDQTVSKNWEVKSEGQKLFLISGELWKDEWVDSGKTSTRVREDKSPGTNYFITDATGKKETKETLINGESRWLWFNPGVINELINRRGGSLEWHTGNTGSVSASPSQNAHFGINSLGLVNVYAEDIGLLPEWQQRIWAGFNCSPEGGVSEELLAAQMQAMPANTEAPEEGFKKLLSLLNVIFRSNTGSLLFRVHKDQAEILKEVHRFRAIDRLGLLSLAKDIARLTADRIDSNVLNRWVSPPGDEKWGSLKYLEKIIAISVGDEEAKKTMEPLFGIWELRLLDAHLPKSEDEGSFKKAGIKSEPPWVMQGALLIYRCVLAMRKIAEILNKWAPKSKQN